MGQFEGGRELRVQRRGTRSQKDRKRGARQARASSLGRSRKTERTKRRKAGLQQKQRHRQTPRRQTRLACRLTGWSHRAISVYYGEIRGTAVSAARRRLHEGAAEKDLRLTFATLSSHAGTLWILQTGCGLVFARKNRGFVSSVRVCGSG